MDYHEANKLKEVADEQIKRARDYEKARTVAGKAKSDLDILLAAKFSTIRAAKSNVGIEAALVMLMENNTVAQHLYREMIENEAKYKSLERIIDALDSKVKLGQSLMRYERENG